MNRLMVPLVVVIGAAIVRRADGAPRDGASSVRTPAPEFTLQAARAATSDVDLKATLGRVRLCVLLSEGRSAGVHDRSPQVSPKPRPVHALVRP